MARQWLRKSELNEKLWKGENILEPSVAGYCRTALSAESLAKMFLLVVVNSIFLLAALHVLHSRREFENYNTVTDRSNDCIRDRLMNHDVHPMPLPIQEHHKYTPIKSTATSIPKVPY